MLNVQLSCGFDGGGRWLWKTGRCPAAWPGRICQGCREKGGPGGLGCEAVGICCALAAATKGYEELTRGVLH